MPGATGGLGGINQYSALDGTGNVVTIGRAGRKLVSFSLITSLDAISNGQKRVGNALML